MLEAMKTLRTQLEKMVEDVYQEIISLKNGA